MKVWNSKETFDDYKNCRHGIRLISKPDVDRDLTNAIKEMLKWLRKEYEFPIRCPIYLYNYSYLVTRDNKKVSASFLAPYERFVGPYIRISVGDYEKEKNDRGRDNAIASIFCSIFHELTHYFQWIYDVLEKDPLADERQARYYAKKLLMDYASTREHP